MLLVELLSTCCGYAAAAECDSNMLGTLVKVMVAHGHRSLATTTSRLIPGVVVLWQACLADQQDPVSRPRGTPVLADDAGAFALSRALSLTTTSSP